MRVNCVRVRLAGIKEAVGVVLDLVTATINHSCEPNAFVFFERGQLRVRSLKKIEASEEITICYLDPTYDVAIRQELLKREHFFDCGCSRCKSERKEQATLLKGKDVVTLHQAQREVIALMRNAIAAPQQHLGQYLQLEDLSSVEVQLSAITGKVFAPSAWPDYLEPMPTAYITLALLHLEKYNLPSALRLGLQGLLMRHCRAGPESVNDLTDVLSILLGAASPPADSAPEGLPAVLDTRAVAYNYLRKAHGDAGKAFGEDSGYAGAISKMIGGLVARFRPEQSEFEREFEGAQGRLMVWAGVPKEFALAL